jgi:hypothetical protein
MDLLHKTPCFRHTASIPFSNQEAKMKSVIYSVALVGCLSAGDLYAQGRGRGGGTIEIPIREPRVITRSAPDIERGNRPDVAVERAARAGEGAPVREPKDVVGKLTDNPALTTRLKDFCPMDTDLGLMAADFRTLGQFVSAVHVSHNLGIPFETLKAKMITDEMSLGEAIKSWKDEMSTTEVNAEIKKAEEQAKEDLNATP